MKKYKIRNNVKIIGLIVLLVLIIILALSKCNTSKSYSLEYSINNYDISENYDINKKYYYYQITKDDKKYDFVYESELLEEHKLIKKVKEHKSDKYMCITIESDYIKTNPLCSDDKQQIDYHLIDESLKKNLEKFFKEPEQKNDKLENYTLYSNENLLIWNYNGFNYIKDGKINNISLFKKDIYEIPLATKINEYIVIPDYEQSYNFNRVYVINLNTLEKETWDLVYDISYNSYINGTHDKSIFITDKKNEIQYELVPHKLKRRIVGKKGKDGIIYKDGISEKISIKDLVKEEYTFNDNNIYKYKLENKYLYLTYADSNLKTKISSSKIDKIVNIKNDNVYYLKDSILYKYNKEYGEIKVAEYEEWSFNNNNPIFIDN